MDVVHGTSTFKNRYRTLRVCRDERHVLLQMNIAPLRNCHDNSEWFAMANTWEKKETGTTHMFKLVSSLSAIQCPHYILYKKRQGIRQFHSKTFIQVGAKKNKILTVLLQVQSENGIPYQIVSLKSSQKRLSKRLSCNIFNSRFFRLWKRFTYLLLTQTWLELNFQWFLIPLLARHLNALCFPNSYKDHLQLYPQTVLEWKQHQPDTVFG